MGTEKIKLITQCRYTIKYRSLLLYAEIIGCYGNNNVHNLLAFDASIKTKFCHENQKLNNRENKNRDIINLKQQTF